MRNLKIVVCWLIICLLPGCKKNAPYEIPVRGNVRNNCTGKGFPNQKVMLSYDNQLFERTTDKNGDFDFGLITVRPKDKTKYKLGIPEHTTEDFELYGITVFLTKEEISEYCQFGISASFKVLHVVYPSDYIFNPKDSMELTFHQKILKHFEPGRIVDFSFKGVPTIQNFQGFTNYCSNINGYPMGWWQVKLVKYKSGQYSTVYDSVFIDMGETKTYVIPW